MRHSGSAVGAITKDHTRRPGLDLFDAWTAWGGGSSARMKRAVRVTGGRNIKGPFASGRSCIGLTIIILH